MVCYARVSGAGAPYYSEMELIARSAKEKGLVTSRRGFIALASGRLPEGWDDSWRQGPAVVVHAGGTVVATRSFSWAKACFDFCPL